LRIEEKFTHESQPKRNPVNERFGKKNQTEKRRLDRGYSREKKKKKKRRKSLAEEGSSERRLWHIHTIRCRETGINLVSGKL